MSLAIGIGATTTILCSIRHLVLRPLPGVADQQELVMLVSNQGGGNVSIPNLAAGASRLLAPGPPRHPRRPDDRPPLRITNPPA